MAAGVSVVAAAAVAAVLIARVAEDDPRLSREQRLRSLPGVEGLRTVGESDRTVLSLDRDATGAEVRRALATATPLLRQGDQWFVARSAPRGDRIPARALLVARGSDPTGVARLLLAVDALPPEVSSVGTFNGAALPTELVGHDRARTASPCSAPGTPARPDDGGAVLARTSSR